MYNLDIGFLIKKQQYVIITMILIVLSGKLYSSIIT